MSQTRCFLRCRAQRTDPIELLTATKNYLGRSPATQIKDEFCSRQQISLDVLPAKHSVAIKQIGANAAGLNGFALQKDQTYYARHGDIVEVLHGKYFYEVCFDPAPPPTVKAEKPPPPPSASSSSSTRSKRQRSATGEPTAPSASKPSAKRTCSTTSNEEDDAAKMSSASAPTPPQPQPLDRWDSEDAGRLLIFTSRGVLASERIAAYDLDGTIIRTRSGNVFPKGYDDWQLAFPEVPGKLKELFRTGHKIVIFTNQAGISTGKTDAKQWRQKLENIVLRLGVPVQAFAATGPSIYRKPKTGMWDTLKRLRNDGVRIDRQRSFFVGDAAGRPAAGKQRRKDHSLADRLFALNVAVPFQSPEEHFQGAKKEKFDPPKFIPSEAMQRSETGAVFEPADALQSVERNEQQVIVMVGAPGSGKTHIARGVLEARGLTVVNQDTLGTWQKCVAALEAALRSKSSAVVDNTNMDAETRVRYVQVAKKMGVKCRAFVMSTTEAHCKHNIAFRELTDTEHSKIPDRLLIGMRNKYKEPQTSEGFADVVKVHCVPQFKKKTDEQLYKMYLVEK